MEIYFPRKLGVYKIYTQSQITDGCIQVHRLADALAAIY